MDGWIKVHKKIKRWGHFKDSEAVHLWLYLMIEADHPEFDKTIISTGKTITVKRGTVLSGRNKISLETGIHRSKIDRLLKCFEIEHQIEQQMFSLFRCITLLNYEVHNQSEQQNEPQVSHTRAASEHCIKTFKTFKTIKSASNISDTQDSIQALFFDTGKRLNVNNISEEWEKFQQHYRDQTINYPDAAVKKWLERVKDEGQKERDLSAEHDQQYRMSYCYNSLHQQGYLDCNSDQEFCRYCLVLRQKHSAGPQKPAAPDANPANL